MRTRKVRFDKLLLSQSIDQLIFFLRHHLLTTIILINSTESCDILILLLESILQKRIGRTGSRYLWDNRPIRLWRTLYRNTFYVLVIILWGKGIELHLVYNSLIYIISYLLFIILKNYIFN